MPEDHTKEKSGCHTCQSTTCADKRNLHGTVSWGHSFGDPSGLKQPHFRPVWILSLNLTACCNLQWETQTCTCSRHEQHPMSKNSKEYLMREEDVNWLVIYTEWEKLAFAQDVKVNNLSVTKKVYGWNLNDYRWSGVDFACPLKDSTVSKTVPSNQILKFNTLSARKSVGSLTDSSKYCFFSYL